MDVIQPCRKDITLLHIKSVDCVTRHHTVSYSSTISSVAIKLLKVVKVGRTTQQTTLTVQKTTMEQSSFRKLKYILFKVIDVIFYTNQEQYHVEIDVKITISLNTKNKQKSPICSRFFLSHAIKNYNSH